MGGGGKYVHEGERPAEGHWHDDAGYTSVLVPPFGIKPWKPVECLTKTVQRTWVQGAVNLEKQAEEGAPAEDQLLWPGRGR